MLTKNFGMCFTAKTELYAAEFFALSPLVALLFDAFVLTSVVWATLSCSISIT